MKTLTQIALAALLLAPLPALAVPVAYPSQQATDSATGTPVTSGVTASVASVTDLDGNPIASPGAVAHVAGGNVSVVYDAAAHGEAWVTLTLTASGHTFNPAVQFCSNDPNGISTAATTSASNGVTLALIKSGQILGTGTVTAATTPTATTFSTTLTATPDLISGDGLIFTSGVNAGKNIHILTNTAGLFGLPGTGLPAAPSAGDTFVLIPFSKALTTFTASLGTDSRPLLSSSDTQAGAETASTLTTYGAAKTADVTGLGTTLNGTLATINTQTNSSARQADMISALTQQGYTVTRATKLDGIGADTPGVTSLLGRPAQTGDAFGLLSPLIVSGKYTAAALANAPTGAGGGTVTDASITADLTSVLAGGVTLKSTEYANIAQGVNTSIVANGLTNRQAAAVNYVYNFGPYTRVKTATTQTLTWPAAGSLPGIVSVSSLDSSGNVTGRASVTFSNLP